MKEIRRFPVAPCFINHCHFAIAITVTLTVDYKKSGEAEMHFNSRKGFIEGKVSNNVESFTKAFIFPVQMSVLSTKQFEKFPVTLIPFPYRNSSPLG